MDGTGRDTEYLSVLSTNLGKYRPENSEYKHFSCSDNQSNFYSYDIVDLIITLNLSLEFDGLLIHSFSNCLIITFILLHLISYCFVLIESRCSQAIYIYFSVLFVYNLFIHKLIHLYVTLL